MNCSWVRTQEDSEVDEIIEHEMAVESRCNESEIMVLEKTGVVTKLQSMNKNFGMTAHGDKLLWSVPM